MILGIRDTRLHHPRLVHFLIQPHFLDNGTYQAFTVCRIVNGKLRSEADMPGLDMQNAQEHGVKGSHPQMARPLRPYLTGYTLLHFARRLVGKGQCQNVPRLVAILQQISNLVVSTRVFPEPAPAITSDGPSLYNTAFRCPSFSSSI